MEFCLHYYGKLKSRDNASGKHQIRQQLHPQIHSVCLSEQFREMFDELNGISPKKGGPHMYSDIGGKRFWYLISEAYKTVVDLNITILLPHTVGAIVNNGGDIDNRIKTLFDALRIPAVESEIPSNDSFSYGSEGMFCLLQDDKLINRVSIVSYQDHEPIDTDSVRCFIEVRTKITKALVGNLALV
jgi:hypothetical protein